MKELFLPYNLSLALKEIGFDEPCISFYYWYDKKEWRLNQEVMPHSFWQNSWFTKEVWAASMYKQKDKDFIGNVAAPLYDQVIEWFIEKHNTFINISPSIHHIDGEIDGFFMTLCGSNHYDNNDTYAERHEALNAGIQKAIELIKQKT